MSWFSDISGKAENLLNSIDKSAAVALNKKSNKEVTKYEESASRNGSPAKSLNNGHMVKDSESDYANYSSVIEIDKYQEQSDYGSAGLRTDLTMDTIQNEVLQNEIRSLNNEISLLLNRAKIAEQRNVEVNDMLHKAEEKIIFLEEKLHQCSTQVKNVPSVTSVENNVVRQMEKKNSYNFCDHYDNQIQELLGDKNRLEEELKNKNDEIMMMKTRLSQHAYYMSNDELESRLKVLTATLVEKQSSLESVVSEKNNLAMKLEALQKKYSEVLGILQNQPGIVNVNDTDDVKARIPYRFGANNLNSQIRHVKNVCSYVNSVTRKTGLLLNRYPVLRISAFIYIILMHIWIFFVTFNNMPDTTST